MDSLSVQESRTMDIEQTAEFLRISPATVRNWIRHNYLTPLKPGGKITFSSREVISLKENLANGRIYRLRKRANKRNSAETFLPVEYLSDAGKSRDACRAAGLISGSGVSAEEGIFFLALNYLSREGLIGKINRLDDIFASGGKKFFHRQIRREIEDWVKKISFKSGADFQSKILRIPVPPGEDFLGAVYQALSSKGNKSGCGAYYTPGPIVEGIVSDYIRVPGVRILDPCCGTGCFLSAALGRLKAIGAEAGALEEIWGADTDDIAVRIARINLIVKCKTPDDFSPNIFCRNTLFDNSSVCPFPIRENFFDLVITNPPWGAKFSLHELSRLSLFFPRVQSGESFSYFIEKGISYLREGGVLSYVLPESFLNVKKHRDIRERVLAGTTVLKIFYLKKAFKNVFTPVIRLDLLNRPPAEANIIAVRGGRKLRIKQHSLWKNNNLEFRISIGSKDKKVLDKIFSRGYRTLAAQAEWALGIVTGDNAKYLSDEKLPGYEGVLTGRELSKFFYSLPKRFIKYEPEKFQQSAPEVKYRAKEKLIYRFISKELVFSYDDKQFLTLNSANILIPSVEKYPVKFILALFNSSLYQYIFRKKFNSIKVLRSSIEALPLPDWREKEISLISSLAGNILLSSGNAKRFRRLLREIDYLIMSYWGLTKEEMEIVAGSIGAD